ncbi:hypothetical protein PMAC_001408 [Pneumocystis sp. 'macacae']|nr:hypothetical protein PMAC_001408 [Pneumocystis sp. 'macacae']
MKHSAPPVTYSEATIEDSDEWIIELLKKEALVKEQASATVGIRAFLSEKQSKDGPPTRSLNKRFLTKMVRNMNAHNTALIQKETQEATQRLHKLEKHSSYGAEKRLKADQGAFSRKKGRSIAFVKQQYPEPNKSSKKTSRMTLNKAPSEKVGKTPQGNEETNIINNTGQNKYIKEDISPVQPLSPSIGPHIPSTYDCYSNAPSLGTLMLDSHFHPDYDPRLDVAVSSDENDDWGTALEAIRGIAQWKKQKTQRLAEVGFSNSLIPQVIDETLFPVYRKGLREWDRGKVVLENGEVETKALGWEKT